MMNDMPTLDPVAYQRHRLHTQERSWAETNCYVDVLIELIHALGHEPIAALPFTVAIDFEGDQWTFFKFPHADLETLFGLDIQELAIWRPLATHIEEQVDQGRPVLVELDSIYLPDTAGTAYRLAHVKSTVAVMEIDVAARQLGYFHGQGYYHLEGDDFVNVLRLTGTDSPEMLPPYVEFVKRRPERALEVERLVEASLALLRRHLQRVPDENPLLKFKTRFATDMEWLGGESLDTFHQYSFATLRQFGACYELTIAYLRWLGEHGVAGLQPATQAFATLAIDAKTLQFQLARAMTRKKPLNLAALDDMATAWQAAINGLTSRLL